MIIFFYGEDDFRSRRKLIEIKQKYLKSDKSGAGLSLFDFREKKNPNPEEIILAAETPGLFSSQRLLVIESLLENLSSEEQKKFLAFLKSKKEFLVSSKETVLVFWEKGLPRKNNALFKFFLENSKKQNFEKLSGVKLEAWIRKRLGEIDPLAKISQEALNKLILFFGSETCVLENELQKLISYADGKEISEKDVEELGRADFFGSIFASIEAVSAGRKEEAFRLVHSHLKKGDDPFYIFSMLVYQFRNLLKVASLREKGVSNQYEGAKILGMHPFVFQKTLSQAGKFSFSRLREIYQELEGFDLEIKTGKIEIKTAIDRFLADVTFAKK